MSAKDRLQQALLKDREERERRLAEGPRPFPVIGQLDSDGVEEIEFEGERPFIADVPMNQSPRPFRVRQWMTGPVVS